MRFAIKHFNQAQQLNHLAHCFLSFGNEDLLVGNFIGDFVKGNDWQNYPLAVQQGILLHRTIDSFTDNHPATNQSVVRVRPFGRRYSAPVTDVLYDYLLAIHWQQFSDQDFDVFAQKTYQSLQNRAVEMPLPLRDWIPKMMEDQFLHRYTTQEGMRKVMQRFSRRLPVEIDTQAVLDYFFEHITDFSADFLAFFPDMVAQAKDFIQKPT